MHFLHSKESWRICTCYAYYKFRSYYPHDWKQIFENVWMFQFSYFVSDSIRLVPNLFHPCLDLCIGITLDPSWDKKKITFLLLSLWQLTASEIFSPSTLWFPNICVHISYSLTWSFSTIVIGELKAIDYLRHRTVWARF